MAAYAQIAQKTWTANREDGSTRQIRITFEEKDGAALDLNIPLVQDIQVREGDRSDEVNKPVKRGQATLQLKDEQYAGDLISKIDNCGYRQLRVTITDVGNNYELFKGYVIADQSDFGLYQKVQSIKVTAEGQLADLSTTSAAASYRTIAEMGGDIGSSLDISRPVDVYTSMRHDGKALGDPLPNQLRAYQKMLAGNDEDANLLRAVEGLNIPLGWQLFQHNGRLVFAEPWERLNNPTAVNKYEDDEAGSFVQKTENHLISLDETNVIKRGTYKNLPPVTAYIHNRILKERDAYVFPGQNDVAGSGSATNTRGMVIGGDVVHYSHEGELELTQDVDSTVIGTLEFAQVIIRNKTGADLYYDFSADAWTSSEYSRTKDFSANFDHGSPQTVDFGQSGALKLAPVPEGVIGTVEVVMQNDITFSTGTCSTSVTHLSVGSFAELVDDNPPVRKAWEAGFSEPGETLEGNFFCADEEQYAGSSIQNLQHKIGAGWFFTQDWVHNGGTAPLGEVGRDRVGSFIVGRRKRFSVRLRDLQRASLLTVFRLKDNEGNNIDCLPVEITHHVLKGYYEVRLVGQFNAIDSTDSYFSADAPDEAGTSTGSTSGSPAPSPSSPSDHGHLDGLNDPADHPWAMQTDFSNADYESADLAGVRTGLDVYAKGEADLRYLKEANQLSELTNIAGAKTFDSQATFNGGIIVNGDIIQNGDTYETHAEQIYTSKDFIISREGAVAGLAAGDIAGHKVTKADGTNDVVFGVDNAAIARVGWSGDTLQAIATRPDSPDDAALAFWDAANSWYTTDPNLTWDGTDLERNTNDPAIWESDIFPNGGYQQLGTGDDITANKFIVGPSSSTDVLFNTNVGEIRNLSGGFWITPNDGTEFRIGPASGDYSYEMYFNRITRFEVDTGLTINGHSTFKGTITANNALTLTAEGTSAVQIRGGDASYDFDGIQFQAKDADGYWLNYMQMTTGASVGGSERRQFSFVNLDQLRFNDTDIVFENRHRSLYYTSGIFGNGTVWEADASGGSFFEVDNMRVRGSLRTHIFKKDIVKASNAFLYISDAGELVNKVTTPSSTPSSFQIHIKEAVFSSGDDIWFKDENLSSGGTSIYSVKATVDSYDSGNSSSGDHIYNLTLTSGTSVPLKAGDTFVRTSGGALLADASSQHSPFLDVLLDSDTKVRLGNVRGIGALDLSSDTWGLYAKDNIFLDFGASNIFKIGKDVGGSGKHGIYIDDNDYWYGNGDFSFGSGVLNGDTTEVNLAGFTAGQKALSGGSQDTGYAIMYSDNTGVTSLWNGTPAGVPTITNIIDDGTTAGRFYVHTGETYSAGWTGRYGFSAGVGKGEEAIFEVSSSITTGDVTALIAGWNLNPSRLWNDNIELHSSGRIRHTSDLWRLNNDGSGLVGNGGINWDSSGYTRIERDVDIFGNLSVTQRNLINNPSVTKNALGWGNNYVDGSQTDPQVQYDSSENALVVIDDNSSGGSVNRITQAFEIDPNRCYIIKGKIKKQYADGRIYFGLSGFDYKRIDGSHNSGSYYFTEWDKDKVQMGSGSNFYYLAGGRYTNYNEFTYILLGQNVDIEDAPIGEGTGNYFYARPESMNCRYVSLRFLNYQNTAPNKMWIKDISVTEVDSGKISANSVRTGQIQSTNLATASGKATTGTLFDLDNGLLSMGYGGDNIFHFDSSSSTAELAGFTISNNQLTAGSGRISWGGGYLDSEGLNLNASQNTSFGYSAGSAMTFVGPYKIGVGQTYSFISSWAEEISSNTWKHYFIFDTTGDNGADYSGNVLEMRGDIFATGTVSWNSDRRLKSDLGMIKDPLSVMNKFRGKHYYRKDLSKYEIGFIAQDLIDIPYVESLVSRNSNNYYSVNYGNIAALHHEAILDNSSEIELLKKENHKLKKTLKKHGIAV